MKNCSELLLANSSLDVWTFLVSDYGYHSKNWWGSSDLNYFKYNLKTWFWWTDTKKPNITCMLAKKKICLKFQLCLCLLILCGFISNCHLKSIWCEIASIYEAPHIFIQIPSKEKKVSDNSFYCGPHKNEFATDNALLYFIHLDFKKILAVCKQTTASL